MNTSTKNRPLDHEAEKKLCSLCGLCMTSEWPAGESIAGGVFTTGWLGKQEANLFGKERSLNDYDEMLFGISRERFVARITNPLPKERIESLEREREHVIRDMKAVGFMGELKCPKDYQCYKRKYEDLCKTEYFNDTKVLCCLEEEPHSCTFSLSYKESYYCQCPLRNYIAEELEK